MNPTTHCNWVFPGKLLIGAYPDPEGPFVTQLLATGVTTFACLQTTAELTMFRDYRPLLPANVKWLQLPIVDRKVATDADVLTFVKQLRTLLDQGEVIYLHCHGGHGRSGTLAVILLHQIEGLPLAAAKRKANAQHRTRSYKPEIKIPQCRCQLDQVHHNDLSISSFPKEEMSATVRDAYQSAGLRGIADLYEMFPTRLRRQIVEKHAAVFKDLWGQLSEAERADIEQYAFDGDERRMLGDSTQYEAKLQDLDMHYEHRRAERVRDVAGLSADLATSMLLDFERANAQLVKINTQLLETSRAQESQDKQRQEEVQLFL